MKLLLDTHIFILAVIKSRQLSPKFRAALADANNTLFLSLVSLWEMQMKIQPGKLVLPLSLRDTIDEQKRINNLQILPVTAEHICAIGNLPFHHKDPFDRLIIAQGIVEKMKIVTADPKFFTYGAQIL